MDSKPTRVDNDDFETADEIIMRVEPWEGSLDPTDTVDYFLLTGLNGDNENDQRNAQLLSIGLQKDSGAAVKAVIYEPNRLEMATLRSDGAIDELEFVVPRDGGFYIKVTTETVGQSASYGIYLGGESSMDNSEVHDKNNVPPGTGISNSVNIADSLDPRGDLMDYWNIMVPSYRALRIEMSFLQGLPFHIQVMDDNMTIHQEMGTDDPHVIENNAPGDLHIILRIYLLLSNGDKPVGQKTYFVDLLIWSHQTRPEIDPEDEWGVMQTNEDTPLIPPINLTEHFFESNNDPIEFELVSEPQNLDVTFNYTVVDRQLLDDLVYVEVEVVPFHNWHGTERLTFKCSDRDGNISDSVDIQVNSVNDPPYITRIGNADHDGGIFNMYALEDVRKVYEITYSDDDDPMENIHFSSNETLGFLSVDPLNGTITIDAVQEEVGNYWFSLDMNDGHDIVTTEMNLDVQAVNDAPPVPVIVVLKGNTSNILPGEEIELSLSVGEDVDGDELLFFWDWGDGNEDEGETVSHIYGMGIYGNKTITLTVSDGMLQEEAYLTVSLQKPEDIAVDNVDKVFNDPAGDVVWISEEWRVADEEPEKGVTVSKTNQAGVDIVSLRSERRGNDLHVSLRVRDSIQIDGSFQYYVYILTPDHQEVFIDFKNATPESSLEDMRFPDLSMISRKYVGDPALHNESTGIIMDQHTLVWVIPLMEMSNAGLDLPVNGSDFTLFAVTTHNYYGENKGIAESYVMSDTAGFGASRIGDISTVNSTGGGGSSPFADLENPTTIGVVIGLVVLFLLVILVGFVLMKRQMAAKKKEEEEFIKHVEKMNDDGQGLFGREKKEQTTDFQKVYGTEQLESFMKAPETELEVPEKAPSDEHKVRWDEDEE